MHASLRLANLKWRLDARSRFLAGILPEAVVRVMRSMSPLRYAWQVAPVEPLPEDRPVSTGPEPFVPVRRSPLWRRILRLPRVLHRHYTRLRPTHSRWQAAVLAARMTLPVLK